MSNLPSSRLLQVLELTFRSFKDFVKATNLGKKGPLVSGRCHWEMRKNKQIQDKSSLFKLMFTEYIDKNSKKAQNCNIAKVRICHQQRTKAAARSTTFLLEIVYCILDKLIMVRHDLVCALQENSKLLT